MLSSMLKKGIIASAAIVGLTAPAPAAPPVIASGARGPQQHVMQTIPGGFAIVSVIDASHDAPAIMSISLGATVRIDNKIFRRAGSTQRSLGR